MTARPCHAQPPPPAGSVQSREPCGRSLQGMTADRPRDARASSAIPARPARKGHGRSMFREIGLGVIATRSLTKATA
jgi:hypothetical protein